MKVLHCCLAAFYIDGFGYQENVLPKMHQRQGHQVAILASTENYINGTELGYVAPRSYETETGIPVTRIPYTSLLPHIIARKLRIYVGLERILEEFKPDIIFVHDLQFLSIRRIRAYVDRNEGVRVFVDCHTDFINSARTWASRYILHGIVYRWCAAKIAPVVEKFYGVLPLRVQFLTEMYGIDPHTVEFLPLGVDDSVVDLSRREVTRMRVREQLNLSTNDVVIFAGGKIDRRKKIVQLMQAIARLSDENLKLIVVGKPDESVAREFDDFEGGNAIIKVGWVKPEAIYDYMLAADLAVFPGTHSVLWEQAVGVGLPAIFRRWPGMNHVDVGGNCLFLESGGVDEITSILARLIRDRSLLVTMRSIALDHGVARFSYSRIAESAIATASPGGPDGKVNLS